MTPKIPIKRIPLKAARMYELKIAVSVIKIKKIPKIIHAYFMDWVSF
jgi:hypothetical protein